MKRTRNPRYAPESLERKLSPVGVVPVYLATAALFYTPVSALGSGSTTGHAQEPVWLPSSDIPPIPFGPAGPA